MACATEADTICHIKASGSGSPIKFLALDDTIGQLKQEGGYIILRLFLHTFSIKEAQFYR